MLITIIAAMDRNRLIGDGDRLPWRLPADLRRFKALTMGKPLVMGRRTHESIGKVLPGRRNVVLSRNPDYRAPGCDVIASLDDALAVCEGVEELMIIGGAELYAEALPRAHRMHLTLLHASFSGDAWFPDYDGREWREISRDDHEADVDSPCAFSFVDLERA
jgi:dihydrofolate reductase